MAREPERRSAVPRQRARRTLTSNALRYLRALIDANDVHGFFSVQEEHLSENDQPAYAEVRRHQARYRRFPSMETLAQLGIHLPEAPEPIQFYRDQLHTDIQLNAAATAVLALQEAMQNRDAAAVEAAFREARVGLYSGQQSIASMGSRFDSVEERLDPMTSLIGRVPIGIPALDLRLGGTRRSGFTFLSARPGEGKTFLLLSSAINLALQGERVVVVSKEMAQEEIEDRLAIMLLDLDPDINVRRLSTTRTLQVARRRREDLLPEVMDNIVFPRHEQIKNTAELHAALALAEPTVALVDGLYFLKPVGIGRGANQTETLTALVRETRDIPIQMQCPMTVTWQQNRGKSFNTEGLYGTDATSQDATLVAVVKKVRNRPDLRELAITKNRYGVDSFKVGCTFSFKPTMVGEPAELPAEEDRGAARQVDADSGRERHVRQITSRRAAAPAPGAQGPEIPE